MPRAAVTIMETSDVHGHVLNWDYLAGAEYDDPAHDDVGLAKVAGVVAEIRADRPPGSTMLVDNGDLIQGSPLAHFFARVEPIVDSGATHPLALVCNAMDYSAVTVGNHEFNYGLEHLAAFRRQLDAPLLGANVLVAGGDTPAFRPYVLRRLHTDGEPVTVGVLGLTTPGTAVWDRPIVEGRLEFADMVATARRWVPELRRRGAEVVVVSAHAGDDGTSSYGRAAPVENASALIAEQVPGIDVVLIGHQHYDVGQRFVTNAETGRQVVLTGPAVWGQRLSIVDIELVRRGARWTVADIAARTVATNAYPPDPRIAGLVRHQHERVLRHLDTVVAESAVEMPAAEARYRATPLLGFVQCVQAAVVTAGLAGTEHAGLPVLSQAAPLRRTGGIPAGPVRIRDIAGVVLFDNTIDAVVLTGAQIADYLEYSARYFHQLRPGEPVTLPELTNAGWRPDFDYDVIAGLDYEIDIARPPGERIAGLRRDGVAVAPGERFVLALNNYRRAGGGGFPHVADAPVAYTSGLETRQALIEHARAAGVIDPATFPSGFWRLTRNGIPLP